LGDSEFSLRFFSALAGVAGVLATHRLGSYLYSQRAGLAAALLASVSPFLIYYSQEVRSYALLYFLTAWTMLAWARLLAGAGSHRARRRQVVGAALLTAASAYVHYSGLLMAAVIAATVSAVAIFGARRELGRLLAAAGLAILLYLPWAPSLFEDLE
jgi:uncharacterized membrane protein